MLLSIGFTSCSDVLEETPRSTFTPEYFKTEEGVKGGITALYANLRNTWGQGYYFNACETGTDEFTFADSGRDVDNFMVLDMIPESAVLKSTNCRADILWGSAYSNINTASGVIENGEQAGIAPSLLAEAYFFRAFDYFQLVQTYGGVPLDFGAGELKFNTTPARTSVRNTVAEVYEKAIIPDLEKAIENLPDEPRATGTVTKTTARLFLSKAYLTYAWWLENPNNIPTYPECTRDASKAKGYFQKAYDMAYAAIKAPGKYGLEEAYLDVHYAPNDRNKEILLYADHTAQDEYFNGGVSFGYTGGSAPDNFSHWICHWNYPTMCGGTLVFRTGYQSYGRPWTRIGVPGNVCEKFADENDSRYEGTFVTAFRSNWKDNGGKEETKKCANNMDIKNGDIVLMFPAKADPNVVYTNGDAGVGAGTIPGKSYYVMNPDHISRVAYLNVWKCGYYNEKTYLDGSAGSPNGACPRPANVARFAEFYFIAAEAAVKGATGAMSARDLLNVVRARAGKWRTAPYAEKDKGVDLGEGKLYQDKSAEMVAATPATITIDYILDERMREFFGEGIRWFDLVRTQKWAERAAKYSICDKPNGEYKEYTRTIKLNHYLRPIPQGQLDAMQMTDEEKAAYQNPGY